MSRFFFKNPEFPLNALILKDIVDLFFMAEFQRSINRQAGED
jgi:hypothetical protein